MTSQSKSKAQRRAEAQRRAAEQRAAELRKKRTRLGLRVGGVVAVVALVIVLIVVVLAGAARPCRRSSRTRTSALRADPGLHVVELGAAARRQRRAPR